MKLRLAFPCPEAVIRFFAPRLFVLSKVTGKASKAKSWLGGVVSASVEIERPILVDREGVAYPPSRRVVLRGKDRS